MKTNPDKRNDKALLSFSFCLSYIVIYGIRLAYIICE